MIVKLVIPAVTIFINQQLEPPLHITTLLGEKVIHRLDIPIELIEESYSCSTAKSCETCKVGRLFMSRLYRPLRRLNLLFQRLIIQIMRTTISPPSKKE